MMTREQRKLINDVGAVLKALHHADFKSKVRVDYQFFQQKALIHWPPEITSTGNGHERMFKWEIIDALKEISDQRSISYKIGHTDSMELVIQIYVV